MKEGFPLSTFIPKTSKNFVFFIRMLHVVNLPVYKEPSPSQLFILPKQNTFSLNLKRNKNHDFKLLKTIMYI